MRTLLLMVSLLTIGCSKPEIVELIEKQYLVNMGYDDEGILRYELLYLPKQRTGYFTDSGHANGSGKSYTAFAHVGDTIRVMYRTNQDDRGFKPISQVHSINDMGRDKLEISFCTPCFKNTTATFKYNKSFKYFDD